MTRFGRVCAFGLISSALLVSGGAAAGVQHQAAPNVSCPWVGSTATPDQRAHLVIAQMTIDDEIAMVHGAASPWYIGYVPANPALCIPALTLEDGPAGVADGMYGVTQLPAPVAAA